MKRLAPSPILLLLLAACGEEPMYQEPASATTAPAQTTTLQTATFALG